MDAARRNQLWRAAQEKIVAELCGIPIYEQLQLWAFRDTLELGYEPRAALNLAPQILHTTRFAR